MEVEKMVSEEDQWINITSKSKGKEVAVVFDTNTIQPNKFQILEENQLQY